MNTAPRKKEIEQLLDDQTNAILAAVEGIVEKKLLAFEDRFNRKLD